MQADAHTPDLRQAQHPAVEDRAAVDAILRISEAVVAALALEAGIPRLLASSDAAEEGLEGPVEPGEYVLQDLRMDVAVFGPCHLNVRQLGALARRSNAHAAFVPRIAALLEAGIVELTAAAQYNRHRALLLGSGHHVILERLAHGLLIHSHLFCLTAMTLATVGVIHPLAQAEGFLAHSL